MRGALVALAAGLSAAVQLRDIQGGSLEPLDVPNDQCGVVVSAQEDDRLTPVSYTHLTLPTNC